MYLSSTHIPANLQLPWGDAIRAMSAPRPTMNTFGTRELLTAQHNKQAIMSSLIVKEDNVDVVITQYMNSNRMMIITTINETNELIHSVT